MLGPLVTVLLLLPTASCTIQGPLTNHFKQWLDTNGYAGDSFDRTDIQATQGSYGGRTGDDDQPVNTPIIFIHGNSDAALRTSDDFSGWENSIQYFLDHGYKSSELYATTWANANPLEATLMTHSCEIVERLRRFLQAVKDYTGSQYVHIISHSMGVTIGRKLSKGGKIAAADGNCNIGDPATFVDVFVGLSGANFGLCNCEGTAYLVEPTCNKGNGFWPGDSCGMNYLTCGLETLPFPCNGATAYAQYLMDLNKDFETEGRRVVSAWSDTDELIMYHDLVWGSPTSNIPRSSDTKTYTGLTHMETKDTTAEDQYNWVNRVN